MTNGHCRREARRRPRRSTGRRRPPPTKTIAGDWKVGSSLPPPGRLPALPWCPAADEVRHHAPRAIRWHRRGAQRPAARAPPRLPTATAQPPAHTGPDGPGGLEVKLQRQGRLRRGEDARLPSTSRRVRRWAPRRLAAGQPPRTGPPPPEPARSHRARERAPPPPSPPGLCPTGPPAVADKEGTRGEGESGRRRGSPPCRLGLGDAWAR
jgi:hypothetical protein